jgi:hypothetical protein
MGMIISRQEYSKHLEDIHPGLGKPDSPAWVPEQQYPFGPSHWFVCVKPIAIYSGHFWDECVANLQGHVKCYSSSDDKQLEWWGFNEFNDAIWFLLRWSE